MGQLNNPAGRRGRKSIHLDMTPMVDLAFLLLTFFVLTMTINAATALNVVMPDADPGEPPPVKAERVITLLLDENDKIYYYHGLDVEQMTDTDYSLTGLHDVLITKKKQVDNPIVILKPTSKSRYKNIVDVLDELEIAKMEQYYITKETKEELSGIAEYKQ